MPRSYSHIWLNMWIEVNNLLELESCVSNLSVLFIFATVDQNTLLRLVAFGCSPVRPFCLHNVVLVLIQHHRRWSSNIAILGLCLLLPGKFLLIWRPTPHVNCVHTCHGRWSGLHGQSRQNNPFLHITCMFNLFDNYLLHNCYATTTC